MPTRYLVVGVRHYPRHHPSDFPGCQKWPRIRKGLHLGSEKAFLSSASLAVRSHMQGSGFMLVHVADLRGQL